MVTGILLAFGERVLISALAIELRSRFEAAEPTPAGLGLLARELRAVDLAQQACAHPQADGRGEVGTRVRAAAGSALPSWPR